MSDKILSVRNVAAFLALKDGARSQTALRRLCRLRFDAKLWSKAIETNGITVNWLVGQLKDLIKNGNGGQRIAAFDRLLGLVESLSLGLSELGAHYGLDPKRADGLPMSIDQYRESKGQSGLADGEEDVQKTLDKPIPALRSVG